MFSGVFTESLTAEQPGEGREGILTLLALPDADIWSVGEAFLQEAASGIHAQYLKCEICRGYVLIHSGAFSSSGQEVGY